MIVLILILSFISYSTANLFSSTIVSENSSLSPDKSFDKFIVSSDSTDDLKSASAFAIAFIGIFLFFLAFGPDESRKNMERQWNY